MLKIDVVPLREEQKFPQEKWKTVIGKSSRERDVGTLQLTYLSFHSISNISGQFYISNSIISISSRKVTNLCPSSRHIFGQRQTTRLGS